MLSLTGLVAAIAMAGLMQLPYIAGNADPATGHIRNTKPTQAWLDKNQPTRMTREIQASECAMNTRLSYPHVQLFAWFKVNHGEDNYHGCPYGDCWAYATHPGPDEVELDFLDSYTFFWHGLAGVDGTGVKEISDPQSGALGYEQSLSGKFLVGPTPMGTLQVDHDEHYPGFDPSKLVPWPKGAVNRFLWGPSEPKHPKCGLPCEENRDPGIAPGAYGSKMYTPAPASAYPPPPNWVPGPHDKCGKNGTVIPDKCASFCSCASHCKDDNCISQCGSKGNKCDKSKCPALPPPPANPPQPGHDSDKCLNYCSCMEHCGTNKVCIKSNCKKIKHGCENDQCNANSNPPPSVNPAPPTTDPTPPPSNSGGSKNPGQAPKKEKKKPKKKKQDKSGNGSDGTGSDGTGSDGTGSGNTGSGNTGSGNTGSSGTGSGSTGSSGTGSGGNDSSGNDSSGNDSSGNDSNGSGDSGGGGQGHSGSGSRRVYRQTVKAKACL
ncbi:uncharacterized protein PGTG_21578 [Puccinia graminis f. sp. tritici CRL 75-36-700-3]|uniref:Chitin-binding type-4 domain-containing protein n=1 Tax=Puccinia graminis f. sp. tritici (strain CRL 75-36-700-3 / race SCCL) TaxID=418459 RepID=H6QRW2_PUCGT|nr:uncharacterized protein PGTG_21578 [Puccinia graminis f. sp. tritici CRL 75-36-700-3]EHS63446.1 hypothetical protein PGTG_21578 [Puccinia graminis f. sp. tritici CRL 75-36-700-3]